MPVLRIGIFVTGAFWNRQYLGAISGHVQIPLMAAKILSSAGCDVTLITTKPQGGECIPCELPDELDVCIVQHATHPWPRHGIHVGKAIRQTGQLRTLLRRRRFDVVHFFGGTSTGLLLCILKSVGLSSVAFYTPIKGPPAYRSGLRTKMTRAAFRRLDHVCATSDCVAAGWEGCMGNGNVHTLRPGITKALSPAPPSTKRNSVLFWRNAGYDNGVDLAMESFSDLAGRYPDVRFVFAVRPHDEYEQALLMLAHEIENIHVHIYPYRDGVTLATLLSEALFVVQPFRRLSVNPQMSILETLYAGVPVIATEIESNGELVQHEENGLLIGPNDEAQLSGAIERLLEDGDLLTRLTRNARATTERRWNWDRFGRQLLQVYREL
jgi:glycosyltransferase involved in cell wall biosynthesis